MTREEAISVLRREIEPSVYEDEKSIAEAIDMAIEALSAEETMVIQTGQTWGKSANIKELAEVVRCKDCKWYKKIVEKSKSGLCHYDLVARCLHDEDFCSHGERREERAEQTAEQTEHKLPGHDEVMEALDKMTLRGDKE